MPLWLSELFLCLPTVTSNLDSPLSPLVSYHVLIESIIEKTLEIHSLLLDRKTS